LLLLLLRQSTSLFCLFLVLHGFPDIPWNGPMIDWRQDEFPPLKKALRFPCNLRKRSSTLCNFLANLEVNRHLVGHYREEVQRRILLNGLCLEVSTTVVVVQAVIL